MISQDNIILFITILSIAVLSLIFTRKLLKISFPYFFTGILGLGLGLWVGSLASSALQTLPGVFGRWLPLVVQVFITVGIMDLFIAQAKSLSRFSQQIYRKIFSSLSKEEFKKGGIIVDTSALIDARLEGLVETGLIHEKLIVPRFVLNELQNIADSANPLRRQRGKRGIEILMKLKSNPLVELLISKDDISKKQKVDSKLTQLAADRGYRLLTVDSNLHQIAAIAGVKVINLHELAAALKPVYLPGEDILVKVVQKGKEKNQGVGYLPDGTMLIVEDGLNYLGEEVMCKVERIYQTVTGKMIFVSPKKRRHEG